MNLPAAFHLVKVTKVPAYLTFSTDVKFPQPGSLVPGRGDAGWTVYEFDSARDAADFVASYPEAAMPCWKRFEVVAGELIQVR